MLRAGDRVLVGETFLTVDSSFADSLAAGDKVLGVASTGVLRRIPVDVARHVGRAMDRAVSAFGLMGDAGQERVTRFFSAAAEFLADESVFARIAGANRADVETALARGRSTTRLVLTESMRGGMIDALHMWRDTSPGDARGESIRHGGWTITEEKAPLGVIGFVFEGRPNVFADATGVLRGGNTVVFRIGSDALGTARSLMENVVQPAIRVSGLPEGCVELVDSAEHAAGWAMFSDSRLSLAVARGSGPAVAELGAIAQQSGIPVSLHGTGGAWMIVGESADVSRLSAVVEHSLDRKVCNTLNVVAVVRSQAARLVPAIVESADRAAAARGVRARIHAVGDALEFCGPADEIQVRRADGTHVEPRVSAGHVASLGTEFEWEENPEFHVVLVDDIEQAVGLFNTHSPQFIVSCVSESADDHDLVWRGCNAPFVGDGFTRWVDGQFALLRPELGLSNWQSGRLFSRSGILSGDSGYTVRLRVRQDDAQLHR